MNKLSLGVVLTGYDLLKEIYVDWEHFVSLVITDNVHHKIHFSDLLEKGAWHFHSLHESEFQ